MPIFYGKPITMDFQDIPVRSVLQTLADFVGMNLVVSEAVTGSITLRLHDVPWDQALDMIVKIDNEQVIIDNPVWRLLKKEFR